MYNEIEYKLSRLQPLEEGEYEEAYDDEEIIMMEDRFKFLDLPLARFFNVNLYYELKSPELDMAICKYIKHLFNNGKEMDEALIPIQYLLRYEKYKDIDIDAKLKLYYFFDGMIETIYDISQHWTLEIIDVKIGKKISFILGELTWM